MLGRIWNALVGAAYNAANNSAYFVFFALIDLLYRWGLGAAPALFVDVIDVANLAGTYANGTLGVGATLTKSSSGVFPTIDGVAPVLGKLYLLAAQSTPAQGGYWRLTRIGSSSVAWQLTRDAAWDASAKMIPGSLFYVRSGTTYGGALWAYTGVASPTVGTTALTFAADSLLRAAVAATITAAQSFAQDALRVLNSGGTFYTKYRSLATANRTFTTPDVDMTPAQAGAAPTGSTDVPSATAAPTFTGTASTTATRDALDGVGLTAAGQVLTTTDNPVATVNQFAGSWLMPATHSPCYIVSHTAGTGIAPIAFTVLGAATTDAGAYKVLAAPTPAGTVAAVPTAAHTHGGGTLTQT